MRTNRRKLIASRELPSNYERLEYIENNSTAYIQTTFVPNINSSFLYTFAYTKFTNDDCFGVGSYGSGWGLHTHRGGRIGYTFGYHIDVHYSNDNSKHSFGLIGNQVIYDDKMVSTFTRKEIDYTYPLKIFCPHTQSPGHYQHQRVYGLKLWDGDILVHDFIPVRHRSDGKIGMLDKIEGQFYTSPNGVEFIGG